MSNLSTVHRAALLAESWTSGLEPVDGADLTAMCDAHDTAHLTDTRWDDVFGTIREGDKKAVLTWEAYRDTSYLVGFMRHDQLDEIHFAYQFPHRWNRGQVRPHIHYVPMSNASGTFALIGEYAWAEYDTVIPAAASWTSFAVTQDLVAADQYKEQIISIAQITPPVGALESSILLIRVQRDTAGADTYTTNKPAPGTGAANIGLLSADTHYQVEKTGTEAEFPT